MQVEMVLKYDEVKELIARHFAVSKDEVYLTDQHGDEVLVCWVNVESEVDEMANFGKEEI